MSVLKFIVTFAEMRAHLDMEMQRQWSEQAIARSMPGTDGLVFNRHTACPQAPPARETADKQQRLVQKAIASLQRGYCLRKAVSYGKMIFTGLVPTTTLLNYDSTALATQTNFSLGCIRLKFV